MSTRSKLSVLLALACSVGIGLCGIASSAAALRFYDDDPLWSESDTQDASGVKPLSISLLHDSLENLFTVPGDRTPNVRAQNVNTVDEVPDSSWFTNRLGSRALTAAEVAKGPDVGAGPAAGPWTVSSKRDGVTPGFTIRDSTGQRWFIKVDPPGYRAMATGTEVVVTKLLWALGYFVPENYIARMRRDDLVIAEGAMFIPPSGKERAMRPEDLDMILKRGARDPDGSYRIIASKALPGQALGGFRFYGTRPDDPNDVVPHEHRRELRGYGVFAAWLNHVDSKSINSLDTLITENGRTFVRHHLLDFSSTLGSASVHPREPWEGYENLLERRSQIGLSLLTLGLYIRPWRTIDNFKAPTIGVLPLDNTKWDPETWQPRFPNAAFLRARPDDKFWAARKLMAVTDEMIRAAVTTGQFGDQTAEAFLVRVLRERRDSILRAYLPALNPIVDPALDSAGVLTFSNAAVRAGVAKAPESYRAVWSTFDNATGQTSRVGETTGATERIQAPAGLPEAAGQYLRVELSAAKGPSASWEQPVHAYFRRITDGWKLVGFERMPDKP